MFDLLNELRSLGTGPSRLKCDGPDDSICLFARFLTTALACECFFHAFLLAGLKVKRVTFHFLDNVLLLYLSLEAAKCILEGLALLQSDFSQTDYTPLLVLSGPFCYGKASVPKSSRMWKNIGRVSKQESHSQLHQAGRIRTRGFKKVRRLLIIRRISCSVAGLPADGNKITCGIQKAVFAQTVSLNCRG